MEFIAPRKRRMSLICPDVADYDNYQDFFRAFIDINKREISAFSLEYFARKIGWPKSVLSDAVSNRRNFTVSRCLQFAEFMNMNSLEVETLIYWVVEYANPGKVPQELKDLFSRKSNKNKRYVYSEATYESGDATGDVNYVSHVLLAVYFFLLHTGKVSSISHVTTSLKVIHGINEDQVRIALAECERIGLIKIDDDQAKVVHKPFFYENHLTLFEGMDHPDIYKVYASSLKTAKNFLSNPNQMTGRHYFGHGFARLPKDKVNELISRQLNLSAWIDAQSEVSEELSSDLQLCQYNISLFPILSKDYMPPVED